MKRVLFIDRDGTIIREPHDFQVDVLDKLRFLPGAITNLVRIAASTDYALVMVTNQDGLGTESFPESAFWPAQNMVIETLAGEGVKFDDVFIDRTFPEDNAPTRKPGTAMLEKYLGEDYDLGGSFVIGDRPTDVQLARNLGARAIYIENENFPLDENDASGEVRRVSSWTEIADALCFPARRASKRRVTSETDVTVEIDLDGTGRSQISTGISFFDHMLEQVARHAQFDLSIQASGDLHVDEHHTIEDVALTLGVTFSIALGDKRGIGRYGFCLPMDDSLAQVAIDLSGRPWLVWNAEFAREKIGEMPTEMFFHFFKSFTDKAECSLNIKAEGKIEHHKIEAIFKAFARTLRMAVKREGTELPSTKGVL